MHCRSGPRSPDLIDTLPGYIREILGARVWHPTTCASEGPARPQGTWQASPGARGSSEDTPTQAHGTASTVRASFSPRERLSVERPNTMQLAKCNVSGKVCCHSGKKPASWKGHASPGSSRGDFWPLFCNTH